VALSFRGKFPLTDFLVNMLRATNDQVRRAWEDPEKVARYYDINVDHCISYLRNELTMRGMQHERAAEITRTRVEPVDRVPVELRARREAQEDRPAKRRATSDLPLFADPSLPPITTE
jgi:hypothetical protein